MPWGWIGVDLNGTLVRKYQGEKGPLHIGPLVPRMGQRVRAWLAAGREVRIVTVLAGRPGGKDAVEAWALRTFGVALQATDKIEADMLELWGDRCVQVKRDTGQPCCSPKDDPLEASDVQVQAQLMELACPTCGNIDWRYVPEEGEGEGGYCVYECKACKHREVW